MMDKREKVIRGLAACIPKTEEDAKLGCANCPYGCHRSDAVRLPIQMIEDIRAELKAQEPRVMTLEEVKQERICWIEDADDGMTVRLFPATMFGIGEYANGSKSYMFLAQKPWAIDANDCEWWYLIEDYGEIWRCWTSRPTDEQRRAEPWKA